MSERFGEVAARLSCQAALLSRMTPATCAASPPRALAPRPDCRPRVWVVLPPSRRGVWQRRPEGQYEVEISPHGREQEHTADVPSTPTAREAITRMRHGGLLPVDNAALLCAATSEVLYWACGWFTLGL